MGKMEKKRKRERERERTGLFRERRHVENVLPRQSRARVWAYKPREFNTLEMSNVEDKMSSGNGRPYVACHFSLSCSCLVPRFREYPP